MPLPARALADDRGRDPPRLSDAPEPRASETPEPRGAIYRAAARRFALLLLAIVGGTALLALPFGLLLGAGVARSVSLGWYIAGSILLLSGFFVGNRGAARPEGEGWFAFSMRRNVRWADAEEQKESISLSAIVVTLGFVLLVLGAASDPRYNFF